MKSFKQHILEKLKVSKIENKPVYRPNTKEELVDLIIKEIETNGPKCSLNHIDVSAITDMSDLFRGGETMQYWSGHPVLSDFDGDISDWDVSNVTNMSRIFNKCKYTGDNGDISDWDVSNVTNMNGMFSLSKFTGDISNWDVSNVTSMRSMFYWSEFDGDISNWDVSNVRDMERMFISSDFNKDISDWDVSNVKYMGDMFAFSKFNGDISNWDVSNVELFAGMFKNSSFNGDISKWKINPKAKGNMNEIFTGSPLENTPPSWYYKYK